MTLLRSIRHFSLSDSGSRDHIIAPRLERIVHVVNLHTMWSMDGGIF